VAESSGRLRLAEKARADVGSESEIRRQQLHGDTALEANVSRTVHDRHPTAPDFGLHLVGRRKRAAEPRE
jgi:hypothetical protein